MSSPGFTPPPLQIAVEKGQALRVVPIHDHLSIGTMPWGRLASIVPDPRRAEDPKAIEYLGVREREQATLRNAIQRIIMKTKKADNAQAYARYIAAGLRGARGNRWTTPPFALWIPDMLEHDSAPGAYGEDYIAYLPFDVKGVLVDAETQHLAHILVAEAPEAYGVTREQVTSRVVAVEIHHGIDQQDAQQIFHDRNLLGVIPNKTVALNSDSRDVATAIANAIMDEVFVEHPRTRVEVPLRTLVSVNKRQLGAKDDEWLTLSTLRSFVVTALFGRPGFERTSAPVSPEDLPQGADEVQAQGQVLGVANKVFNGFYLAFVNRTHTVIATPAVLAAIGAVAHHSMSWSSGPHRTTQEFFGLLKDVIWERDPQVWDGIAGKATPSGNLSVAGGVKDNGSKTATALEDESSTSFYKIRRRPTTLD